MERTYVFLKLTAIATVIVVAILCLGFSNAYGLTAPQMQLNKPGGNSQTSYGATTTTATVPFDTYFEDGSDFDNDGNTPGSNDAVSTVPEPTSLILLGVGLAGIKLRRRRH